MQGYSNYTASKINDHIFGATPYTAPSPVYFALAKGTVSESDTGSTFDEADYGGYARISLSNNTTNFPNSVDGVKEVATDLIFPIATSGSNTIKEVILLDNATGGNIIGGGVLTIEKTVSTGTRITIYSGEYEITVS